MVRFNGLTAAVLVLGSIVACSSSDGPYDENWGADEILGGKADGLYDIARQIEFGDVVYGNVGGDQINVYKMELVANDRFVLEETVTSGDLDPHISLFAGASSYIGSENWEKDGNVLRKWYRVESTGTYLLALRAYQGTGRGDYSLTAKCVEEPCGEEPDPPMDVVDVGECLSNAHKCAFERMGRYNGAVGPVRAQKLLDECLQEGTYGESFSCSKACEQEFGEYTEPSEVCDVFKEAIIFYADQSEACLLVLEDCMSECEALGDNYSWWEGFRSRNIVVCFVEGMNSNCDRFAQGHEICGGSEYGSDSSGECFEFCYATDGAWLDDLDSKCSDDCNDLCQGSVEICQDRCEVSGGDWSCVYDCLDELDPYCA